LARSAMNASRFFHSPVSAGEFCCQTGLELCRNAAEKPVTEET